MLCRVLDATNVKPCSSRQPLSALLANEADTKDCADRGATIRSAQCPAHFGKVEVDVANAKSRD